MASDQGPTTFPDPYIVEPETEHNYTIILLHGRGDTARNFAFAFFEMGGTSKGENLRELFKPYGCKWIFPNAPLRITEEYRLKEWFLLTSLKDPEEGNEKQTAGLRETAEHVRGILEQELKLVPADKIILLGISQGFASGIHALLSFNQRLGAFVGFAGWLPFQSKLQTADKDEPEKTLKELYETEMGLTLLAAPSDSVVHCPALQTPLFVSHSTLDPTVGFNLGVGAWQTLQGLGMSGTFHQYDNDQHWIKDPEDYDNLVEFLEQHVLVTK